MRKKVGKKRMEIAFGVGVVNCVRISPDVLSPINVSIRAITLAAGKKLLITYKIKYAQ
jgi:hypothetical protein